MRCVFLKYDGKGCDLRSEDFDYFHYYEPNQSELKKFCKSSNFKKCPRYTSWLQIFKTREDARAQKSRR